MIGVKVNVGFSGEFVGVILCWFVFVLRCVGCFNGSKLKGTCICDLYRGVP